MIVACLGDSNTSGQNVTRPWPVTLHLSMVGAAPVVGNYGISGGKVADGKSAWTSRARPTSPAYLVIALGTNDFAGPVKSTPASVETDLASILSDAASDGIGVVICTIPPLAHNYAYWTQQGQDDTDVVNAWIAAQASSSVVVVDLFAMLVNATNTGMHADYAMVDGIHYNQTAHDLVASTVKVAIDSL